MFCTKCGKASLSLKNTVKNSVFLWFLNCFYVVCVDILVEMLYYIKKCTQESRI